MTDIFSSLPAPFGQFLEWTFGPGWWFWLIPAALIAGVWLAKSGHVKQEVKVEPKAEVSTVPTAEKYLEAEETQESEPMIEIEEPDREKWNELAPKPKEDPRLHELRLAYEEVNDKMLEAYKEAVKKLIPTVTFETKKEEPVQVQAKPLEEEITEDLT